MWRITLVTKALQLGTGAGSWGSSFKLGKPLSVLLFSDLAATAEDSGRAMTLCALESVTWGGTDVPVDGSTRSGL